MAEKRNMIRVVMVIQEYHPIIGGAERQLASQAALLKNKGLDIHVVTRRWPGLSPFEVINGIPVYRMLSWGPRPIAAILFIITAVWKLYWLKPDIIHAFELLSPSTISVLSKWLLHRPLIVKILRGGVLGDLTKIGSGLFGKLRIRFVLNAVDVFVVISNEINDELRTFGVEAERRIFIPNGVDTTRFTPADPLIKDTLRIKLGLPDGLLTIFTGRLEIEKRLDLLIFIWAKIRRHIPNAYLLLVGIGSQEAYLRSIAGEGVIFVGEVEDTAPYLIASDIFVLPSISEGLSNSLLEALSCELAVIATSIGGTTDVVVNNVNGLLVNNESPEELMSGLMRLLNDSDFRRRIGVAGRQTILEKYSMLRAVTAIRNLYSVLLSK